MLLAGVFPRQNLFSRKEKDYEYNDPTGTSECCQPRNATGIRGAGSQHFRNEGRLRPGSGDARREQKRAGDYAGSNEITIVGRRHTEALPGNALFRESQSYDYRRVFELDPVIDTTKVSAKMDQGVLTLTLPKSEKVKPRKIKVD